MPIGWVRIQPDSITGKAIETRYTTLGTSTMATVVHRQVVIMSGRTGSTAASEFDIVDTMRVNDPITPGIIGLAVRPVGPPVGAIKVLSPTAASFLVNVGNFPPAQGSTGTVAVSNFPAQPYSVSVTNFPPQAQSKGTVAVSNFPQTQTVGGTVDVGNFPGTQPVSGTVSVGNFPVSKGTFAISNFPATQTVSGSVSIAGQPITVTVTNPSSSAGTTVVRVDNRVPGFSPPRKYLISLSVPSTNNAADNLLGLLNPAGSGLDVLLTDLIVINGNDGAATGKGHPIRFFRAAGVGGGSLVTKADIPKKDTAIPNSVLDIRVGAGSVTGTKAAQSMITIGGSSVSAVNLSGPMAWWKADSVDERIVLHPGEGVIMDTGLIAGDANDQYRVTIEWEESPA